MDIRKYIAILWRRKLPILLTLLTTMAFVGIATKRVTPVYETTTVLRVAVSDYRSLSNIDYISADRLLNTYLNMVTSSSVMDELMGRLNLSYSPGINAEIVTNTELIEITVEDTNPTLAATVANTLADILASQDSPQYSGGKNSSQKLLLDEISQAKTEFDQALQYYYTVQAQILPSTQQLDAAEQSVRTLQNYYIGVNTQYEEAILQADSQANVALQAQKEILAKQVEILAQRLNQAKIDLDQAQDTYNLLQIQAITNSQQLDAAQQVLRLKRDFYTNISAQYTQAILQDQVRANMITVVDSAVVPQSPSRPNVALNYALGLMVGLIGGVGLAFIFESLDTKLYEISDVETTTKLPVFARIPKANKKQINSFEENLSPLSEAFRGFATNLQGSTQEQSKNILLIMSAEPNQGKSMSIFHLACALAEFGKTVVVVDGDTRMPQLHNIFHLPNEIGLNDVLKGEVEVKDALQKSTFKGVHVLTSGTQLVSPSQMLKSVQMAKLVKSLSQKFDYVLIDAPAMLVVADALSLAPLVSGFFLVVRLAHGQKDAVQAASNYLAEQTGKFTYLIVNEVTNGTGHYRYYRPEKKITSSLSLLIKNSGIKIRSLFSLLKKRIGKKV